MVANKVPAAIARFAAATGAGKFTFQAGRCVLRVPDGLQTVGCHVHRHLTSAIQFFSSFSERCGWLSTKGLLTRRACELPLVVWLRAHGSVSPVGVPTFLDRNDRATNLAAGLLVFGVCAQVVRGAHQLVFDYGKKDGF